MSVLSFSCKNNEFVSNFIKCHDFHFIHYLVFINFFYFIHLSLRINQSLWGCIIYLLYYYITWGRGPIQWGLYRGQGRTKGVRPVYRSVHREPVRRGIRLPLCSRGQDPETLPIPTATLGTVSERDKRHLIIIYFLPSWKVIFCLFWSHMYQNLRHMYQKDTTFVVTLLWHFSPL